MASAIAGSDGPSRSLTSVPNLGETARCRRGQPDEMAELWPSIPVARSLIWHALLFDRRPRIAPGPFCPSGVGGLVPNWRLGGLRPFLDWARRQLQYRSPLPGNELSD